MLTGYNVYVHCCYVNSPVIQHFDHSAAFKVHNRIFNFYHSYSTLTTEWPWTEHLTCLIKRRWVVFQEHSSTKECLPLLAASTCCKSFNRQLTIVYVTESNFAVIIPRLFLALDSKQRQYLIVQAWTCHSVRLSIDSVISH